MTIALQESRETVVKQPDESRTYAFDFSNLLESGETLLSGATIAAETTGLTIGSPAISGKLVKVVIADGANGSDYVVQCSVTTSLGNILAIDGRMQVRG